MIANTTIVLLHGAGGKPWTMNPIMWYLQYTRGCKKVHNISYDYSGTLEECIESAHTEIQKVCNDSEPIIVIGQSLGGVIGCKLHTKGWTIEKLVAIVSPLRGARLVTQIRERVPEKAMSALDRKVYQDLERQCTKEFTPPPHPYATISTAWPFTDLDGCVYKDEAKIDDENHHHIPWSDHRTIFASPRLMLKLNEIL